MGNRLLIVDDSATIRHLVRAYLVGLPFAITEASDVRTGLQSLRASPVDVVLSDVFMPVLTGWDFVRQIRADTDGRVRGTPVILASSRKTDDVRAESLRAGANVFITKPFVNFELVETIKRLTSR